MLKKWKGGICLSKSNKVLKIAFPAVGEMFLYMMVWVIDTMFVGNYGGKTAVSAVGFSSEIVYTAVNICIAVGVSVGITTTVANSIGADNKDEAENYLSQGFLLGTIIAFIISCIFGFFPHAILKVFGAKGDVLYYGTKFLRVVSVGTFFNMLCSMLNAGLRGTGNTVIPFAVSVIINIITIALDDILIFGKLGSKEFGIVGSAIATSTAYFAGFIFLLVYYIKFSEFKLKFDFMKGFKKKYISKIVNLSVPSGSQEGAFSISRLVTLSFIMHMGETAFSANQITTTIESVSFMPGWGFGVAATALVGQRIGAKDFKNAREYAYISMIYGTLLMCFCSILFLLIPRQLITLFIKEADTIKLGTACLMIASIEQPFMGVSMVLGGALKGAGDTKTPFLISFISSWVIRIPLMYLVIYVWKLPVQYVWVVTSIQWAFDGIAMIIAFKHKSKKWGQ